MLYLHPAPVKGIITSMQLKLKFFCFKYILVANPKAIIGSAYAYKFSTYASTQNNLPQKTPYSCYEGYVGGNLVRNCFFICIFLFLLL